MNDTYKKVDSIFCSIPHAVAYLQKFEEPILRLALRLFSRASNFKNNIGIYNHQKNICYFMKKVDDRFISYFTKKNNIECHTWKKWKKIFCERYKLRDEDKSPSDSKITKARTAHAVDSKNAKIFAKGDLVSDVVYLPLVDNRMDCQPNLIVDLKKLSEKHIFELHYIPQKVIPQNTQLCYFPSLPVLNIGLNGTTVCWYSRPLLLPCNFHHLAYLCEKKIEELKRNNPHVEILKKYDKSLNKKINGVLDYLCHQYCEKEIAIKQIDQNYSLVGVVNNRSKRKKEEVFQSETKNVLHNSNRQQIMADTYLGYDNISYKTNKRLKRKKDEPTRMEVKRLKKELTDDINKRIEELEEDLSKKILDLILYQRKVKKESTVKVQLGIIKKYFLFVAAIFLINASNIEHGDISQFPSPLINNIDNLRFFLFVRGPQIAAETYKNQLTVLKSCIMDKLLSVEDNNKQFFDVWVEKEIRKDFGRNEGIYDSMNRVKEFGKIRKSSLGTWTVVSTLRHLYTTMQLSKLNLDDALDKCRPVEDIKELRKELQQTCSIVLVLFMGFVYFCRANDVRDMNLREFLMNILGYPHFSESKQSARRLVDRDGNLTCRNYFHRIPHLMGLPTTVLHLLGFDYYKYNPLIRHLRSDKLQKVGLSVKVSLSSGKIEEYARSLDSAREMIIGLRELFPNISLQPLPPPPDEIIVKDPTESDIPKIVKAFYGYDVMGDIIQKFETLEKLVIQNQVEFVEEKQIDWISFCASRVVLDVRKCSKQITIVPPIEDKCIERPSPFVKRLWEKSYFNELFLIVEDGHAVTKQDNLQYDPNESQKCHYTKVTPRFILKNIGDLALDAVIYLIRDCRVGLDDTVIKVSEHLYRQIARAMALCNIVNFGIGQDFEGSNVEDQTNADFNNHVFLSKSFEDRLKIASCHILPNSHTLSHFPRVTATSMLVSGCLDALRDVIREQSEEEELINDSLTDTFKFFFNLYSSIHLNHSSISSTCKYYTSNFRNQTRNAFSSKKNMWLQTRKSNNYDEILLKVIESHYRNDTEKTSSLPKVMMDSDLAKSIKNSFWFTKDFGIVMLNNSQNPSLKTKENVDEVNQILSSDIVSQISDTDTLEDLPLQVQECAHDRIYRHFFEMCLKNTFVTFTNHKIIPRKIFLKQNTIKEINDDSLTNQYESLEVFVNKTIGINSPEKIRSCCKRTMVLKKPTSTIIHHTL